MLQKLWPVTWEDPAGDVLRVPRDHATAQAAVDAARPGDRVVVAAGVYRERVLIEDKRVEVVGQQGGGTTIECEGNANAVHCTGAASNVRLAHLTLRYCGGVTDRTRKGAVQCSKGGTLQMESCDASSDGGSGIDAQDEGSDLRLRDCTVHDCLESGILVSRKARATVEGCTVRDNQRNGVGVSHGASATLRGNTCTANQANGIDIYESEGDDPTSAVVEGNRLRGNRRDSLHVAQRCQARVQQSDNEVDEV